MTHKEPLLKTILARTSLVTEVSISDIVGRSRKEEIVDARQIFSCAGYYSGYTYKQIGDVIDRDHSSIIHICNERPLSNDSLTKLKIVREGHGIMNKISSLAFIIYKNPNDQQAAKKLKKLL